MGVRYGGRSQETNRQVLRVEYAHGSCVVQRDPFIFVAFMDGDVALGDALIP
jgi:hypothetical protein